jgi:hypothetical protein
MQILPFPRRFKQSRIGRCADCGAHFERASPRHVRCRQCFLWMRGCRFVLLAARSLRAARQ